MRRIKKRNIGTVRIKRNPYVKNVKGDAEETIVEETLVITPERVTLEEKTEPVCADVAADVENSVAEVETEVEAAEEKAEAEVAEETVTEETEPAEETAEEVEEEPAEEPEEKVVEDTVTITPDEVVFDEEEKAVDESEEEDVEEAVSEAEAEEAETAEEATEEAEEVPLEASEEESEEILDEEGSLDGTEEEARALSAQAEEEEEVEEPEEVEETEEAEEADKPAEKAEKEAFKLTAPANQDDVLSKICVKRGRKLIYRPNEIIFNCSAAVTGTDKNNEEGIKIKNILDEEIKQGVKLGYIDKYDGLKMSEIKEEYENDVVYEYAEQEFKRVGLVPEGEKVKVYVYDWDMKALHHIGFVDQASVADLKPYLENKDKYSFDICGLITGGKFRKVVKDEATGKITVEKGNDGKLGVELDISIIDRKD